MEEFKCLIYPRSWLSGAFFFTSGRVSCGELVLGEELWQRAVEMTPWGPTHVAQLCPAQSRDVGLPPGGFTIGRRPRRGLEQSAWVVGQSRGTLCGFRNRVAVFPSRLWSMVQLKWLPAIFFTAGDLVSPPLPRYPPALVSPTNK